MKNDVIYPIFVNYLELQVNEGKLSKGKFSLLKMSSSYFESFKKNFETDELFKNKVLENWKVEVRDKKIDDIFDDFDL